MITIGTRILAMGLGLGLLLPVAGRALEHDGDFDASSLMAQEEAELQAQAAYRAAREALNRSNFEHAVQQFSLLRDSYPASQYAGDTYYWQAFALYRLEEFKQALQLLDVQLESFPDARTTQEAKELQLRLQVSWVSEAMHGPPSGPLPRPNGLSCEAPKRWRERKRARRRGR
jgi:outer membrane protein assembly factor BamD (BamD/ComL family)